MRDGSTRWDIWALSAMILEADMEIGDYRTVANERGGIFKAMEHTKKPQTCEPLRRLLNKTMLRVEGDNMEGLDFVSQ
jgi:hypothetical protein